MKKKIFLLIVIVLMIYPLYGGLLDKWMELSGVTEEVSLPDYSLSDIMDGSYQTALSEWWEENFPGRTSLIKVRGQLLYTLVNQSSNTNVVIGKDKYLFEPGYITSEFGIDQTDDETYFVTLKEKLETLQVMLNENGKELYIFITPSKAYFCSDKVPWQYSILKENTSVKYNNFINTLQQSELKYFDSRNFIENYDGPELEAPVFYPTGTHWSSSWGMSAALAFEEYMNDESKWELSKLELVESKTDEPQWPDADLYQSLNLIGEPSNIQYYTASLIVTEEGEKPNVFFRGASFMGQSLNGLISAGVFNKNVHLENSYYFTDNYTYTGYLSGYEAYDEMDLEYLLGETDILILEVNEAAISQMSFGFIDYLLEHPQYIEYPSK